MKVLFVIVVCALLVGCGSEGYVESTPKITNMRVSPNMIDISGARCTIMGTYDYVDLAGDLEGGSATITVYNPSNIVLSSFTSTLTNIKGRTSGIMYGPGTPYNLSMGIASYFNITITDALGNRSNVLSGNII